MPVLRGLNLSHTSINSLPDSLANLVELRQLILRDCSCFMMLPPEVGALNNLEVLDLEGTPLIELPEETRNLVKLKTLTLSFYGQGNSSKEKLHSNKVIHPGTISNLSELKELQIDVDPDDERWDETMDEIVEEICGLEKLTCLSLYLPNIEMLWKRRAGGTSLIFYPLSQFTFTVGHHKNRITSRVPNEIEAHFKGWDKGLKIVKGRTISTETKAALRHATAFFLDSHATCSTLSDFGIGNMEQLKFCLLAECNRIRMIMDSEEEAGSCSGEPFAALPNVGFLILRYLKNLESFWRRQVGKHCLSNLKFLALHTCHNLRYVLHPSLLANLNKLEELIVEDCYEVTSLVLQTDGAASNSASSPLQSLLPSLKRMSLLSLPDTIKEDTTNDVKDPLKITSGPLTRKKAKELTSALQAWMLTDWRCSGRKIIS